MAKRVYFAYHPESDCVLKTYDYDEWAEWIMYDTCDSICYEVYKRLELEIKQCSKHQTAKTK